MLLCFSLVDKEEKSLMFKVEREEDYDEEEEEEEEPEKVKMDL